MLVKPIYNSNLCVPSSSSRLLFQRMGTYHKKKITENFNHYFWNFCVGEVRRREERKKRREDGRREKGVYGLGEFLCPHICRRGKFNKFTPSTYMGTEKFP